MAKSHVLTSQFLMRGFAEKDKNNKGEIYFFDIENNTIKRDKIRNLDSIEGYYSPFVEKELADIESKFGNISTNFKKFLSNGNDFIISFEHRNLIRIFFDLLLLRNETIINRIVGTNHIQELDDFFSDKSNKSLFFRYHYPLIVYNRTNRDFLLPRCVIYMVEHNSVPQYICPINHKAAIVMVDKKEFDSHVQDNYLEYGQIFDEHIIMEMNIRAYYAELETSGMYLFGSQNELNKLLSETINNC